MNKLLSFILMSATLVGCTDKFTKEQGDSAREVEGLIDHSDTVTIYSLDPKLSGEVGQADFHGCKIIGQKDVMDPSEGRNVLNKLADSIRQNTGIVAACFNPRHGLSFKVGNAQVDYVLCFECSSGRRYGKTESRFLLTNTGNTEFNVFLEKHGIQRSSQ